MKKNQKLYYWLGGLAVIVVVGAVIFSQGTYFQGMFLSRNTELIQSPIRPASKTSSKIQLKTPITKNISYKGACVIRDQYTSLPDYSAPASGTGYAKVNKGSNFSSFANIDSACTQADFNALISTYCPLNEGGQYQKQIGMYNQDGSYNTTGPSSLGADYLTCPVITAPSPAQNADAVIATLLLSASSPQGGAADYSSFHVMDFLVAGSGPTDKQGIITDITYSTGTCAVGKVDLYEGNTLLASSISDGIISANDFANGLGLIVQPNVQKDYRIYVDSTNCMVDEVLIFTMGSFMYNDGTGSEYQLLDSNNGYLPLDVYPIPFSSNKFYF